MKKEYICNKCGGIKDIVSWRKDGNKEVRCRKCRNTYCSNYQKLTAKAINSRKRIHRIYNRIARIKYYETSKVRITKGKDGRIDCCDKITKEIKFISEKQLVIFILKELEDYAGKRRNRKFNSKDEGSSS